MIRRELRPQEEDGGLGVVDACPDGELAGGWGGDFTAHGAAAGPGGVTC
jgi:hypothetical protein